MESFVIYLTILEILPYFKSQKIKASVDTIINYIGYIESAMIIHKAERYDIKGKKFLEFYDKVYLNDVSLRNGLIGYKEKDINAILENIVFSELEVRGYTITVVVFDGYEIDFIVEKQKEKNIFRCAIYSVMKTLLYRNSEIW